MKALTKWLEHKLAELEDKQDWTVEQNIDRKARIDEIKQTLTKIYSYE